MLKRKFELAQTEKVFVASQQNFTNQLEQCFSTFWASSPGKRQIFKSLSRLEIF